MTQTVFKYPFQLADHVNIAMPDEAELLTVQVQNGQPCLWALVDPTKPMGMRMIRIRGTGHDCDDVGGYISTFQMDGGALIFHVFE